jgi:hypothetical protein
VSTISSVSDYQSSCNAEASLAGGYELVSILPPHPFAGGSRFFFRVLRRRF